MSYLFTKGKCIPLERQSLQALFLKIVHWRINFLVLGAYNKCCKIQMVNMHAMQTHDMKNYHLGFNIMKHPSNINWIAFQKYGISLTALAKLQMNLLIQRKDGSGFFEDINQEEIYYPFAWIKEGIPGPSEVIILNPYLSQSDSLEIFWLKRQSRAYQQCWMLKRSQPCIRLRTCELNENRSISTFWSSCWSDCTLPITTMESSSLLYEERALVIKCKDIF